MEKKQPYSPRYQALLAGVLITLGVILIFGGAMYQMRFDLIMEMDSGSGCGPRYEYIEGGFLSCSLTTDQPQASKNLTQANAITISLTSEDDAPIILTIQNSQGLVYLNITHPNPLTHGEFGLEIGLLDTRSDYLVLTIQRTTNDTHVTVFYDTYQVDRLCIDYMPPGIYVIIITIVGLILTGSGFLTLNKVGKKATW